MRSTSIGAAFVAACLLCSMSDAAKAEPVDPGVYGALPDYVDVRISPDGKTLAALQTAGDTGAVVFYDVDNPGTPPVGIGIGSTNPRTIEWADNEHLLLLISQSSRVQTSDGIKPIEFFRWLSVSKSKQKAELLFNNEAGYYMGSAGDLLATPVDAPGKAIFARSSASGGAQGSARASRLEHGEEMDYSLFEVDLASGRIRRTETGEPDTEDWIVAPSGRAVARVDYNETSQQREVYVRAEGESSFKLTRQFAEPRGAGTSISFYGLSTTPGKILAATYGALGRRSLVEFDLETGDAGSALFSDPTYDIDYVEYDARTAAATAVRYTDDLPRTYHLDESLRQLQKSLEKALPGAAPMITSKSADGARMIVECVYTDHPTQFFLYDKAKKTLNMVAPSYQALDGRVAAAVEKYDYAAPDGLTIHGYLAVPAGASKSNMPLIVLPHGGPESRDNQAFDWWSFFYAARGYLVYQPNFRGSDGYGAEFRESGFGEWGRKMQDDITNGVKKLIADGIVDPKRICIVGGSYGGYAALAGATLTPGLYACAVSINGVSNLPGMLGRAAQSSGLAEDYWETRIGSRFRDAKELNAVSPAKIAGQAGAPILLIHSKDDIVVPIEQSRLMGDALKSAGKAYEFIELKGEDHWLSSGATRTEMLARSIEFIDRHIGAATVAAAP